MPVNGADGTIPAPSTEWMHSTFAFLELHDVVLILLIIVLFSALGGGPLIRSAINWFLRLIGRGVSETIVNVGTPGGDMADKKLPALCEACGLIPDPSKCIAHQAEHERSLRNEEQYKELWLNYGKLRDEMQTGFKEIRLTVMQSQQNILDALAGIRPGFGQGGKGGHE